MYRRTFLKAGMGGVGAGLALVGLDAYAQGGRRRHRNWMGLRPRLPRQVDAEAFADTVIAEFIDNKRSCAESMLIAGCDLLRVRSPLLPEMTYGLAGGIGFCGYACGFVTGGAMILSMAISAVEKERETAWPAAMTATKMYVEQFEKLPSVQKFAGGPTADCRDICGLNLRDPAERAKLGPPTSVKGKICQPVGREAAMLLAGCVQAIVDSYRG